MRDVSACLLFDCCIIPPPDEDVAEGKFPHSTTATIHPLEDATQRGRGGNTGRVADMLRSSSSMSSVFSFDRLVVVY